MTAESPDLKQAAAAAILRLRQEISWKPGAASRHLLKRKLRGHLSATASLSEYHDLIRRILTEKTATIYVYYADDTPYLAVSWQWGEDLWLVISSLEGVIETAFVVENPESYLNRSVFHYLGQMEEVVE